MGSQQQHSFVDSRLSFGRLSHTKVENQGQVATMQRLVVITTKAHLSTGANVLVEGHAGDVNDAADPLLDVSSR